MTNTASPGTPRMLKQRLYVMMFLQYFMQGAYLPVISLYLRNSVGFTQIQIGMFASALAIGPIVAQFFIGQVADRHVATDRVLAFCHAAGGMLMIVLYFQKEFLPIVILGTVYSILYVPTMMLTNSLTFDHLSDRDREFPWVRLWGTIGFIVPAWAIEWWWLSGLEGASLDQARGVILLLSGGSGLLMAAYCLTLPSTPPKPARSARFAPWAIIKLLERRDFRALVIVSLLVAIVHKFYFVQNSLFLSWVLESGGVKGAWEQRVSSIGQVFEIFVMTGLGLAVTRYGFKNTMLVGAGAYLLRCLIFAGVYKAGLPFPATMAMVCAGQALHGLCFACFLAAAYMFVDRVAPRDVRSSMQTMYGTFVLGLGAFAGGVIAGGVGERYTTGSGDAAVHDWGSIWLACAAMAVVALVMFAVLFPGKQAVEEEGPSQDLS